MRGREGRRERDEGGGREGGERGMRGREGRRRERDEGGGRGSSKERKSCWCFRLSQLVWLTEGCRWRRGWGGREMRSGRGGGEK